MITFLEKRKFQRNLIIIFAVIVLITFFVLWQGFFVEEKSTLEEMPEILIKKVEINLEVLEKNPLLKEFLPFEEIKPFEVTSPEEKTGRENPFIPY